MFSTITPRFLKAKELHHDPQRSDQVQEELMQSIHKRINERRTFSDKLADFMMRFVGTFYFVVFHVCAFTGWVLINLDVIPGMGAFDPYPFNFLTLTVSLEAIFLAIFVLISQNRESRIADLRQEFDVQVNIIAEKEITKIIHLLAYTMNHLNVPYAEDAELRRLMRPLNIDEIRDQLEQQLELPKDNRSS